MIARRRHAQLHVQGLRHNSSAQHLTSSPCHGPWHLQEQGYEKLSPGRASSMPPGLGRTVLPGGSVAALQARSSPSEVKLSASHRCQQRTWENPTSSGTGAGTPATPGSGVPRDLLCSLASPSPFLCLAIYLQGGKTLPGLKSPLSFPIHTTACLQMSCMPLFCLDSPQLSTEG